MPDWINPLYAWIGLGGTIIAVCVVVAIYFPPFRKIAIAVAGGVAAALAAYAKGQRDRSKLEQARKEKAVAKAREQYDKIDNRPDTPDDAVKRMRDGSF